MAWAHKPPRISKEFDVLARRQPLLTYLACEKKLSLRPIGHGMAQDCDNNVVRISLTADLRGELVAREQRRGVLPRPASGDTE